MFNDLVTGIIYRIYDSGAYDKVFLIIDSDGSKIAILAKGIRKQTSKKAQAVKLGNLVKVKILPNYNLPLATEIKIIKEFEHFTESYEGLIALQLYCEVVDKFAHTNNHDPLLFKTFIEFLENKSKSYRLSASVFLLKILENTGNLPDLKICTLTGSNLDPHDSGITKKDIGFVDVSQVSGSLKLDLRIIKSVNHFTKTTLDDSLKLNLSDAEITKILDLSTSWMELFLGYSLKSKKLLNPTSSI